MGHPATRGPAAPLTSEGIRSLGTSVVAARLISTDDCSIPAAPNSNTTTSRSVSIVPSGQIVCGQCGQGRPRVTGPQVASRGSSLCHLSRTLLAGFRFPFSFETQSFKPPSHRDQTRRSSFEFGCSIAIQLGKPKTAEEITMLIPKRRCL